MRHPALRLRSPPGSTLLALLLLPLTLALGGCLEVDQHPAWRNGAYNGKPDDRPEASHFAHDRLAWHAALVNRNYLQNEYRRLP
jgi:hypothetical protein